MNAILIAPPASEPVSLAEAKSWLRVDASDEDEAIASLIAAARAMVEAATRRVLVTQTWRLVLDAWPANGSDGAWSLLTTRPRVLPREVALPLAPAASVSSVSVYDAAGQPQALDVSLYRLVGAPEQTRLVFDSAPPAPGLSSAGIEIDIVAGYGDAADVPAPLRHAILALVAWWFEHRGDVVSTGPDDLPPRAAALIAPYRRRRLA